MKTFISSFWIAVISIAIFVVQTAAEVPALLSYQGRIAVGQNAFDGAGQFKFALVNADVTKTYWRNAPDPDGDGEPDQAVELAVSRGLYSVLLGNVAQPNMAALPPEVFNSSEVFLRVWFSDGVNPFQRLVPDQRVAAVGYALMAANVPDGVITLSKLATDVRAAIDTGGSTPAPIDSSQIPNLDAAKVTTGRFPPERLPLNVAYIDPDIVTLSNAIVTLSNSFNVEISRYNSQLDALLGMIGVQSNQIATLSNQVKQFESSSIHPVTVSADSTDSILTAAGYSRFSTTPEHPWVNGSTVDAPGARQKATAVWTGNEMIVWGGIGGGSSFLKTGGAYSAGLDDWTEVSTLDSPTARAGHTAVWTGQEMIIWGGESAGGAYESTGGRFHRGNGQWHDTSLTDAPSKRAYHVAVWTGSRMLIWGGRASGLAVDAALYDPSNDQWTPLSLPDQPVLRYGATAVWTGDRIIIWGGYGLAGELNSGGQLLFDAAGNPTEWLPVTTQDAPGARQFHTAIWTGTRMIVWGGSKLGGGGTTYFNDGAAYDPVSKQWQPVSATGAPFVRANHNALWTGQEMLIFNGENSSGALASGAAYNLANGEWRPLSSLGSPLARKCATAAWTGTDAIVFGGRDANGVIAGLQSLNPEPPWHFYRKP